MRKGQKTREAILRHAVGVASQLGVEGLTVGRLAADMQLSKSGLFAHFHGKEALQIEVLRTAAERFTDCVVRPALTAPRGERRVRALFERWLVWETSSDLLPGGCPFTAANAELDDRPGPVREYLVRIQRDFAEVIARTVGTAIAEGDFRRDVDSEQFAHDLYGIFLAFHHAFRLMRDPKAKQRAETAFDTLVRSARQPTAKRRSS